VGGRLQRLLGEGEGGITMTLRKEIVKLISDELYKVVDYNLEDKIMQAIEARMLTVANLAEVVFQNIPANYDGTNPESLTYISDAAEAIHAAQLAKLRGEGNDGRE
jgi:hypothetical protein